MKIIFTILLNILAYAILAYVWLIPENEFSWMEDELGSGAEVPMGDDSHDGIRACGYIGVFLALLAFALLRRKRAVVIQAVSSGVLILGFVAKIVRLADLY